MLPTRFPSPSTQARRCFAVVCLTLSLLQAALADTAAGVQRTLFGRTPEGIEVEQFTLTNARGAVAKVITLGATVTELLVPDRDGKMVSVVNPILPSDQVLQRPLPQAASIIGRFANRIAHGRFTLDGREIVLPLNSGKHHIHGGRTNFARVHWRAEALPSSTSPGVRLTYRSRDGEEGFPGTLETTVTYTLTPDTTLRIEYGARTDQPTVLNLTNHAYFNLGGQGDVRTHQLQLNAERYTVVDADLIPTGELRSVSETPLDFRQPKPLGARASQLPPNRRYDHNFVLSLKAEAQPRFAARVEDPVSGRTMEVWTTEPGVQLYTSPLGERTADERTGFFCLETQHFPDSVNHPHFPSTVLRPADTFRSVTEFRFGVK